MILARLQAQRLAQHPSGLQAFAVVGVAQIQQPARQAMEGQDQLVAPGEVRHAVLRPEAAHLLLQGGNIGGMVVKVLD
ncbi:hypothetical protein D3C71_1973950 [compost metagenome]